jgi:hypothetical protein
MPRLCAFCFHVPAEQPQTCAQRGPASDMPAADVLHDLAVLLHSVMGQEVTQTLCYTQGGGACKLEDPCWE